MSTVWPNTTDAFTTKTDGTIVYASHMNNVQDSIVAVQTEIARTYRPDLKPSSPSAYDDEFETGVLDPKWTAINCALGTVDLLSVAAAADTYDPATYRGMMALQPGRDDAGAGGPEAQAAMLRQTVTLGTNCKIVVKMYANMTDESAFVLNNSIFGVALSGANGFVDNDWLSIGINCAVPGTTLIGAARIGGGGVTNLAQYGIVMPQYLMIVKTGNNFSAWGGDGRTWAALVDGAAPDNAIFTYGAGVMARLSIASYWAPPAAEINLFNPITVFDFVRYFANNTPVVNA